MKVEVNMHFLIDRLTGDFSKLGLELRDGGNEILLAVIGLLFRPSLNSGQPLERDIDRPRPNALAYFLNPFLDPVKDADKEAG